MKSKNRSADPFSLIKFVFFLFILFHLLRSFSPPALNGKTIKTAERTTLSNLLVHLDKYVGKPVVVDQVRVINPCHFYLGSFYYVESLDGQSRLLVLSREFPPKEGKVITILGSIQPVISVNNVNMAFFREAAVQPVDLPSTYSDRISQNAVFPSVILFPGYPSESLGVSSAERWTAERGKPSGVEAERVQEAWSIQRQTGSLFPLYVSSSYPLTSLSVNRSTGSPCSHS